MATFKVWIILRDLIGIVSFHEKMLKLFQGGKSTFERELNVLSDCKCEFIIKLYAIYEFPDGKGLILEYSQRSLGMSWIRDL